MTVAPARLRPRRRWAPLVWTVLASGALPLAFNMTRVRVAALLLILGLETGDMQVEKSVLSNSTHSFPVDIAEK